MTLNFRPTIKLKLFMMGFGAVLALALLSVISWNSSNNVQNATHENQYMLQQARQLADLRVASFKFILAAMDSIIDADEGYVYDERLEVMDENIEALRNSQGLVDAAAMRIGKPELSAEYAELTNVLDRIVRVELVQAIESRAGDLEFARFGDDLDEFGHGLVDLLAELEDGIGEELNSSGETLSASVEKTSGYAVTVGLFFSLGLILVLVLMGRSITTPLAEIAGVMRRLADGDLEVEIDENRTDEIGEMAEAVKVFKDNAMEKAALRDQQAARERRAEEEKRATMMEMADRFEQQVRAVVDGVSNAAGEMQATAQQMAATAEETSRQSANVAAASDEATVNVQTVAATAEELSVSISEIGKQVNKSAEIAADAVRETEATNETVQGLADAASTIGEVVGLINNIAGQTNLLALNATIEAARAGEAGKGFAVVANEVKNLANQTAKATEEIASQISRIQAETTGAVDAIVRIRGIINEVNDIASSIATAVEQQGVSTQEIARNVQRAATGTQDVNTNIENVSRAAGETGTAAGQVLNASRDMARQAEGLRVEVDRFLAEVRAS